MIFVIVIALAVGGATGAGLLLYFDGRQAPANTTPTFSGQQTTDAKDKICSVYSDVHSEVVNNAGRDKGTDPVQQLAVTATIREAFFAGSVYLLTTLSEEPATPTDLASAVRKLAMVYQKVTIAYLNGKSNSELGPIIQAGDEAALKIQGLCA